MLENTFIHIPGIGPKTEERLWDSGIHSWDDFTLNCPIRLSQSKMDTVASYLKESKQNLKLDHAHIDLRYILGSLGYRGGLKSCEIQLEIDRGNLKDIDGFFAVLLWHDYKRAGNKKEFHTACENC